LIIIYLVFKSITFVIKQKNEEEKHYTIHNKIMLFMFESFEQDLKKNFFFYILNNSFFLFFMTVPGIFSCS
jgi:hypothetical protein